MEQRQKEKKEEIELNAAAQELDALLVSIPCLDDLSTYKEMVESVVSLQGPVVATPVQVNPPGLEPFFFFSGNDGYLVGKWSPYSQDVLSSSSRDN